MEQTLFSLHAESRRYSRYETRIRRIAQMLGWAKRHWVVLALAGFLIAGAAIGFLLAVGTFSGSLDCESLIYGEAPQCSITAFLSKVHYQYAAVEGEAVWSDELPTHPGTYRIRAVSKNGFGHSKYSDSATFTLLPRDLAVVIHPGTFVYGSFSADTPRDTTELVGLADGDQVQWLDYATTESKKGTVTASVKALRIANGAGQDVTACYRISCTDGSFTMMPRPITVSVKSDSKIYDGQEWTQAQWELTEGSLAENDALQASFAPAPATAGSHLLEPQCVVQNAAGEDVTACYRINVNKGALTVTPRPITVQTGSASKEYDATPLTASQWSITDGEPIQGHTLVGTVTGSQTAAGQSLNRIELKVFDADGADVSNNYALEVEAGTLTVTPIILKINTASREKVYDGLALTAEGWSRVSGTVLRGHTLSCRTTGSRTNAGSSENTLRAEILDSSGRNVTTEGYRIEAEYGTLTVIPRPITITSDSAEKLYDGYPLTCHTYIIDIHAFDFGTWDEHISRTYFTGSQKEVGSSANTFTVEIADYTGEITTFNYSITYIYGTLAVLENPNPPDILPFPNPSPAPGLPGEETSIEFPENQTEYLYAQVEGYSGFYTAEQMYFRYLSYGDYTGSGWSAARPYPVGSVSPLEFVGRSLRENASIQIHLINDCPALLPYYLCRPNSMAVQTSDCYYAQEKLTYNVDLAVGYDYRDLKYTTTSPRLSNLEAEYRQFVHGQYLQIPDPTKQALLQWAAQNGIRADSPTLVEDIQSAIINAAVYNAKGEKYPQGVDVAVYFLTEAKEGVCQHFATAATLMYRAFGIPARYTVGFVDAIQKNVLVNLTSQDAHAWVEIYVDGLGWVPMEVTGSSLSQDVKTELCIQSCSVTKIYDGKGFDGYDLAQYTILSGTLRKGHRLVVTMAAPGTANSPGEYMNRIERCVIYDESGKDVTSKYYNIHITYGSLKILPRQITVTIGSASKVYDGQPLTCADYWISQGSLAPGHELKVVVDSILQNPGSMVNSASEVRVLEKNGVGEVVDCSSCYEIIVIPGELEIAQPESG